MSVEDNDLPPIEIACFAGLTEHEPMRLLLVTHAAQATPAPHARIDSAQVALSAHQLCEHFGGSLTLPSSKLCQRRQGELCLQQRHALAL
jgi:hypothetical protein